MLKGSELGQYPIQKLELARRPEYVIIADQVRVIVQEKIGMVATLPQLHHEVHDGFGGHTRGIREFVSTLVADVTVEDALP